MRARQLCIQCNQNCTIIMKIFRDPWPIFVLKILIRWDYFEWGAWMCFRTFLSNFLCIMRAYIWNIISENVVIVTNHPIAIWIVVCFCWWCRYINVASIHKMCIIELHTLSTAVKFDSHESHLSKACPSERASTQWNRSGCVDFSSLFLWFEIRTWKMWRR